MGKGVQRCADPLCEKTREANQKELEKKWFCLQCTQLAQLKVLIYQRNMEGSTHIHLNLADKQKSVGEFIQRLHHQLKEQEILMENLTTLLDSGFKKIDTSHASASFIQPDTCFQK